MKNTKRILLAAVAALLLVAVSIGGTMAWLAAKTDPVTNTFTPSDISITLAETKSDFKMVPGATIEKDPVVTVKGGSEACWLFVKVEKSNLDNFISYELADGWTELTSGAGVYYREVAASAADQPFNVLKDNKVTVKYTVTKAMMEALKAEDAIQPSLTFTAYAIQQEGFTTAAAAWEQIGKETFDSTGANTVEVTP